MIAVLAIGFVFCLEQSASGSHSAPSATAPGNPLWFATISPPGQDIHHPRPAAFFSRPMPPFSPNGGGHKPRTGDIPGRPGLRPSRAAVWSISNFAAMYAAYRQSQTVWGESRGKFHFKDDLIGDGMALSDEVSHLFAAYRLTLALNAGYRWIGLSDNRARRAAAAQAWLWTFAVEFPIDAFNPTQGFGVSDLAFNTIGVLAAYRRTTQIRPRWDVKISVKRQFLDGKARVVAQTNEQYDDYIYWLTYRPIRQRYLPFLLGIGYATDHPTGGGVTKEIHIGIGTSLEELGAVLGPRAARFLRPLNFFFFTLDHKISWR